MQGNIDILIISDLHLKPSTPQTVTLFKRFLAETAPSAKQLYILGDFFELWIGDDAMDDFSEDIAAELAKLEADVFIMPGNRDVLIGKDFCHKANATFINDPYELNYHGQQVLLCHGDHMCTSDISYQRYRRFATSKLGQKCFLSLPRCIRQYIAKKIRQSSKHKFQKNPTPVDVSHDAVIDTFKQHHVSTMIHGHTHMLGEHEYPGIGTRYVNRDWHETGSYISLENGNISIHTI